jgi:hypothetical protein
LKKLRIKKIKNKNKKKINKKKILWILSFVHKITRAYAHVSSIFLSLHAGGSKVENRRQKNPKNYFNELEKYGRKLEGN